jgi:hypothetical protein
MMNDIIEPQNGTVNRRVSHSDTYFHGIILGTSSPSFKQTLTDVFRATSQELVNLKPTQRWITSNTPVVKYSTFRCSVSSERVNIHLTAGVFFPS